MNRSNLTFALVLVAGALFGLSISARLVGCTAQQVQSGLTAATQVDSLLTARAQAAVDVMPSTTPAEVAAKAQAQARANAAATNRELYLLLAEIAAPTIVKVPTSAPTAP